MRDNIHRFGGDKNQITIFGQSAGSCSVSAHVISPLSKGLFNRAILESGAFMFNKDRPVITTEEALLKAKRLAKQLNCTDDKQWLECLRKVDAKHLQLAADNISQPLFDLFSFPVVGTEFLPISAQQAFHENKFNKGLFEIILW